MDVSASWQYPLAVCGSNSVECEFFCWRFVSWCEHGQWHCILRTACSMSPRGMQTWHNLCLFAYRPAFTMSFKKIVLKSTTMMSLNERWEAVLSCWQAKPQPISLVAAHIELTVGICPTKLELSEAGERICVQGDTCSWLYIVMQQLASWSVLWVWILAYLDWGFSWFSSVSWLH